MPSAPSVRASLRRLAPLSALLLLLALGACTPAAMRLEPGLAERSGAMPVQGRMGWQIGQTLSYGPYATGPVERGWTLGYDVPFVLRFRGAREALAFRQFAPHGAADVVLANRLRDWELPVAADFFSVAVIDETALAGSVIAPRGVWDLFVQSSSGDLAGTRSDGFVRSADALVTLHEVREFATADGAPALPSDRPLGYEFRIAGRIVGAVELIDGGRVWLEPSLDGEQHLVLASVASSLLLRSELAGPS